VISGAQLGITKNGTGAWTLAANNTFGGPLSITAGTLNVTGSVASATTISGGTLNLGAANAISRLHC
jgi:autotransporter-associated beta strand protein